MTDDQRPTTLRNVLRLAILAFSLQLAPSPQIARAQGPDPNSAQVPQTQGAVSTGGAHAAVLDSEKRPITAGGFVDSGPIIFQDIPEKAGLTKCPHFMGTTGKKFILENIGSWRR